MSMPWAVNVSQIVEPRHILATVKTSKGERIRKWILTCGIGAFVTVSNLCIVFVG